MDFSSTSPHPDPAEISACRPVRREDQQEVLAIARYCDRDKPARRSAEFQL
jgi:hypothetical protein